MTMNCDEIQITLVELLFDEADEPAASRAREHLDGCCECRRRLRAFREVREDLEEWNDVAASSRIAFVAMPSPRRGRWRWLGRAAVAAGMVLGLFLAAGAVDLRVQSVEDGWTVSTSLWSGSELARPGPGVRGADGDGIQAAGETGSEPVRDARPIADRPLDRERLSRWLDDELARRGLPADAGTENPSAADDAGVTVDPSHLSDAELRQVRSIVDRLVTEREETLTRTVQDMITTSQVRQRQRFNAALTNLYQSLEAQHFEDLSTIANQLGIVQLDTGERLEQTSAAIDYLIQHVAAAPGSNPGQPRNRE